MCSIRGPLLFWYSAIVALGNYVPGHHRQRQWRPRDAPRTVGRQQRSAALSASGKLISHGGDIFKFPPPIFLKNDLMIAGNKWIRGKEYRSSWGFRAWNTRSARVDDGLFGRGPLTTRTGQDDLERGSSGSAGSWCNSGEKETKHKQPTSWMRKTRAMSLAWVTALETLRANHDAASADEAAGVEIEKQRRHNNQPFGQLIIHLSS